MKRKQKHWIVTLSTYPPRACGIATYASSLNGAIGELYGLSCESRIIAMNRDAIARLRYPREVLLQIEQQRLEDYIEAAEEMNELEKVKLVHIQHEFGIFGGDYGAHLLEFTSRCKKPMVITFHTVLPEPTEAMRAVVEKLGRSVSRVTVMTGLAKRLLQEVYGVDEGKIDVIPHGIPVSPLQSTHKSKESLGLQGRTVLMTFGLLSRGKGIEYVIEALPEVVKRHPSALYLVVGVTHPDVVLQEGEAYRNSLMRRVRELGLASHVLFYNEFVSNGDLLEFLQAADVYVATSLDPNQAVSGTLSYALGSGRPVISTAFAQAKELVTPNVGELVDFRKPEAYAEAMLRLLGDAGMRLNMGREAYFRHRRSTWPNVALSTFRSYTVCDPTLGEAEMTLPPIKLSHVEHMTDDFGMFQFADLHQPNHASGYTIDDNARALLAMAILHGRFRREAALPLASTYLRFLQRAAQPTEFSNGVGLNREDLVEQNRSENPEDALGRAFQSLACTASSSTLPDSLRTPARVMVEAYINANPTYDSPRAAAFLVDGLYALWGERQRYPMVETLLRRHCDRLVTLYRAHRSDDWEWFETCVTYANGVLPEALLLGWKATGDQAYLEVAKKTLDFLISKTFQDGVYLSIGQKDWCHRGAERSYFDQQPEEAASMVRALSALLDVAPDGRVRELREQAFSWFLGRNMLGQTVYDRSTGGCCDGISEDAVNLNQGAESTVSYLLARLSMES